MLMMLAGLMGGSYAAMVPKLKPLLVSFGGELVDKVGATSAMVCGAGVSSR